MTKTFTCIVCPNGCEIRVESEGGGISSIQGNLCPKGIAYVKQETLSPKRTFSTSVRVLGGELPLVSVRVVRPIPKERIFDAMAEVRKIVLAAPVKAGQVIIADILGLGADVIATKDVASAE